jgi:diguanylate cyclase (GGDEF)-like protein
MNDPNIYGLWQGAYAVLRQHGCNLFVLPGGTPKAPENPDLAIRNVLYDLISPQKLDGLLIWAGSLNAYISVQETEEFLSRFGSIPVVSLAFETQSAPCVLLDNESGTKQAVGHLIHAHGCRRIAFVRGPDGHTEAEIRHQAYKDALADAGIPFDPYLSVPGSFDAEAGEEAVRMLIRQKVRFDALVSNDDSVAVSAIQALQRAGLNVPQDVRVVGFDDQTIAASYEIPLTTVRIPNFTQGQAAAELLLQKIRGDAVPASCLVTPELVVRRSCGCSSPVLNWLSPAADLHTIPPDSTGKKQALLNGLLCSLHEDLQPGAAGSAFIARLEQELQNGDSFLLDTALLVEFLFALRQRVAAQEGLTPEAERLLFVAALLALEKGRQRDASWLAKVEQDELTLFENNEALAECLSLEDFGQAFGITLSRLEIPDGYLSLYMDDSRVGWSRLVQGFKDGEPLNLDEDGVQFESVNFAPDCLPWLGCGESWVVLPLDNGHEPTGLALLRSAPRSGVILEAIRSQLANAVKGVMLRKKIVDLSLTDELTGIGNRRLFEMFLQKEIEHNRRYKNSFALLMLDVDNFKSYNDTFGHPAGDQVLTRVAAIINSHVRRKLDVVARLGGDEFAVILVDTSQESAAQIAESIRHDVASASDFNCLVSVSVGIASARQPGLDEKTLLSRADQALYLSKSRGKNRVSVYEK